MLCVRDRRSVECVTLSSYIVLSVHSSGTVLSVSSDNKVLSVKQLRNSFVSERNAKYKKQVKVVKYV